MAFVNADLNAQICSRRRIKRAVCGILVLSENFSCQQGGMPTNMKATGIVRRIDELGRVVIPKEIRNTLRLKSGDPILTTLKKLKRGEMSDKCVDLYIKALFSLADRLRLL